MGEKLTVEIIQRLLEIIERIGVTQRQFCISIGVQSSWLSMLKAGKQKQITDTILLLLQYMYGINLDWLLIGEGEMFLPDSGHQRLTDEERVLIERFRACSPEDRRAVSALALGFSERKNR